MIKFFKQFLIYGFASIIGKIVAIFLMPLYTSVLSQEEYGVMAIIISCSGIIGLVSNLNIHSGVARDFYEESVNLKNLVSTGLHSILATSTSILLILLLTKNFWVDLLNINGYEDCFILMLFSIPSSSLMSYFSIITRNRNKPIQYTVGVIIQLVLQISISVITVLHYRTGIVGVFWGLLISQIVSILYYLFLNRDLIGLRFETKLLKSVLIFSIPTLPAVAANWIDSSLGQVMIGKFISVKDAGIYSVALQFSSIYLLFNTAFSNTWYPFLYESFNKPNFKEQIIRIFNIVFILLCFIGLNLTLLSKDIVLLLTNISYIKSSEYIILLVFPMSIMILNWFSIIGPNITKKTKYISYAYVFGSAVNLLLLIVFLKPFGIYVIPIALSISRIISYFISNYYTKIQISINLPNEKIIILFFIVIIGFVINKFEINRYIIWSIVFLFDLSFVVYFWKKYNFCELVNFKNRI